MNEVLGKKSPDRIGRNPDRTSQGSARGPIITCVGPKNSFSNNIEKQHLMQGAEFVNWKSGNEVFLVSKIDQKNKRSEKYQNCTGIAVVGLDKKGRNVSFLTHQSILNFLSPEHIPKFAQQLEEVMKDFSERLDENNPDISAVIFGGNYFDDLIPSDDHISYLTGEDKKGRQTMGDDYRVAIKMLGQMIQDSLHVKPHVAIGANMAAKRGVEVVLDTLNRRLYMMRPVQPGLGTHVSFEPDEVDARADIWKKDIA